MPIGSHIIPRFYLEQFSVPPKRKGKPGRIWVYERGKVPDQRATSKQGVENGYFAYRRADGSLEESLETQLADLEAKCNEILPSAKSELFYWSYSHKKIMGFYAALLFQRATQSRNVTTQHWSQIQKGFAEATADEKFVAQLADRLGVRHKYEITPDVLKQRLAALYQKLQHPAEAKNAYLEKLLWATEIIHNYLLDKPWQIWKAPSGSEFVTSDNPLVTFVRLQNGALHPGYGFRKPGVVAAFPLAPDTCLAMGPTGPEFVKFDHLHVMRINEVVILLSDRFVYSRTRSEEIQKLVDGCGGAAKYGETAFMPVGMELPSIKDFLREQFGLPHDDPS